MSRPGVPSVVEVGKPEKGTGVESRKEVGHLTQALQEALKAADPRLILSRALKLDGDSLRVGQVALDLAGFRRILVLGGGKASGNMAAGLEQVLGDRIGGGVVIVPAYQMPRPVCRRITVHPATHPIPSKSGVAGVQKMLRLIGAPKESDLAVCLISGGGSALMPFPLGSLSLRDVQSTTDILLKSGAEIAETNTVRKHLSGISGGRLAQALYPATVLSLIISDVVGDPLDAIASGPTAPDPTTFEDAEAVLRKYDLWRRIPPRVRGTVSRGVVGKVAETPKKGSRVFERVHNVIVGSNRISCLAAAKSLRKNGYTAMVTSTSTRGEARDVGRLFAGMLLEMAEYHTPAGPPACIIAGGETTVTVSGRGVGGRNQELVLAAALEIDGSKHALIASMGTDGVDGPTTAAGAVADGELVRRERNSGEDARYYLKRNDSNSFFREFGGLLLTGPTGTNVNDIIIAMAV